MISATVINIPFLSRLDTKPRGRLVALAATIEIPEGGSIFRRGDAGGDLYLVQSGSVALVDARTNPETVLEVLGPGDLVGEMGFIDGASRSADARARGAMTCLRWRHSELVETVTREPDLGLALYRALAEMTVTRGRAATSSALVGAGLGRGVVEAEPALRGLDQRVAAFEEAGRLAASGDAAGPQRLREALLDLSVWIAAEPHPAKVGSEVRHRIGGPLGRSVTGKLFLSRPNGGPLPPSLAARILGEPATGGSPERGALDRALLDLPALRGIRWRGAAVVARVADALPRGCAARGMVIRSGAAGGISGLVAAMAGDGGHLLFVGDARSSRPDAQPEDGAPGVRVQTLAADLVELAGGRLPPVARDLDFVVVDGLVDLLPLLLARTALAWAHSQLAPGGLLLATFATPSADVPFLAHVLRWPVLARKLDAVSGLLPDEGELPEAALADGGLCAGGLIALRRRK